MSLDLFTQIDTQNSKEGTTTSQSELFDAMIKARHKNIEENKKGMELNFTAEEAEIKYETAQKLAKEPVAIYSLSEAVAASTEYFGGDEMAGQVWVSKYALKDSEGNIYEKTPDDMHHRLAKELARIEMKYQNPLSEELIYSVLKEFKYIIPQGSPMAGIGNNFQIGSLSNCFVIGNKGLSDSYGGIMKIDQEQVQLMKRRGGVGHDLSGIRPKGSPVKNSALTSTGIVPFMERFSNSTREVAQDGRRGALMLSISIKHPDAESFIDAKMDSTKVTGANVSMKITDDFMKAVINEGEFTQQYPVKSANPTTVKQVEASHLWNKIVHNAWKSAEPGILFWDTIIRESLPDCYADLGFETVSTNPCGEIPLCPYDSCRLLALNLYSYVENPFTTKAKFNHKLFADHIRIAQRLMDDIIDLEQEKIDKIIEKIISDPEEAELKLVEKNLWTNIRKKTEEGRRTGIGITAEGDMLAALNLKYGSDEAIDFSVDVHKYLATEAYWSSTMLAKERGAFPVFNYEKEKNNPFINRLFDAKPELKEAMLKYGRRNIALLTIAPTGTVSMMTQSSSGIEPVFKVAYSRRRKVNPNDKDVKITFVDEVGDSWETFNVLHHKFVDWMKINGYDTTDLKSRPEQEILDIVAKSPYAGATSEDIDWVAKVKMQGAVQKWVDHSISVTVNVPNDVDESLISNIYKEAWKSGCKGMTVYRDGSRSGVLISKEPKKVAEVFTETQAPPRPARLEAEIVRFQNNHEKWLAVIGILSGRPYEIFSGKAEDFFAPNYVENGWIEKVKEGENKSRYDFYYVDKDGYEQMYKGLSRTFDQVYWNYAKLISGLLRHGMPVQFVVDNVNKLRFETDAINTWKAGIVRALKKFIPDGTIDNKNKCPECGSDSLAYKEGCLTCTSCGYSKCG